MSLALTTTYEKRSFQRSVIGQPRYRAAIVAVSRSLGRLQARAVLQRAPEHGGWLLTDKGRAVVQAVSGNG